MNKLIKSKAEKLKEWEQKIQNGEAIKEVENFLKSTTLDFHPKAITGNLAKGIYKKQFILDENLNEKEQETLTKAFCDFGINNDLSVYHFAKQESRGMIINLRRELIKEFDCKTYSEKALVDLAVNAYARNYAYSARLLNTVAMNTINSNINTFLSIMSKEIDRANRHYITAIENLRALKQPEMQINVKTRNAFISQNQQFNNNSKETNEKK